MKIALGVSGCIAAYKAAELVRQLQQEGLAVQVVMTRHAQEFIRPLTFAALTGKKVITEMFEAGGGAPANLESAIEHIGVAQEIEALKKMTPQKLKTYAKEQRTSVELVKKVRDLQRLPVVTFVAGGVATPADAALLMALGAEGVFVGSGIFKSKDPRRFAEAIVQATVHYKDAKMLTEVSTGLGMAMPGLEITTLPTKMQERGL